ncbi:hypothetical protein NDU88_005301 [Pleurodeles waltl]|uniref:Uncharacterized protein n=1 Tax=Pleurodeles waltl TaxID=8319 RepID=A0AAV7MAT8_PLEWA|nr:hypothetical protein NDU88_005301 [Pleurodeles waltl]
MAATKSVSRRVENRIHRPPARSQRTRAPEGTRKKTSSKLPVAESSHRRRREQKPTKPDSVTAVDEVQCARVRKMEAGESMIHHKRLDVQDRGMAAEKNTNTGKNDKDTKRQKKTTVYQIRAVPISASETAEELQQTE